MAYGSASIEELNDGIFRKVRRALSVTAFGVNATVVLRLLDCGTFLTTVRGRRFVAATVGARLRHVIIEVSHPSLVEDLLEFLRSSSCEAMRCGGQTVDVRAGWPLSEGGQRHLDLYLAAWEAKNPGARAARVG
jgi:hypothetical protein